MKPRGPVFPGVRPPSIDFQAVRDQRRSRPLYVQFNLDAARSIANGLTTDITDASGKALQLNIAGNSWWADPLYDSGGNYIAGIVVAHFEDTALGAGIATPLTILPNAAQRIPFTTVIIENFAQAGKKARLVYGVDLDFVPGFNAQLLSSVTLDGNTQREIVFSDVSTRADEAWEVYDQQAAVAAQNSHVQLFNPVGSGIFTYVDRIRNVNPPGATSYSVRQHNAALGTAGAVAVSKDFGSGAVAKSLCKKTTNAGLLGTLMREFAVNAGGVDTPLEFRPPIRLREGQGVQIVNDNVNQAVNAAFEFRERTT